MKLLLAIVAVCVVLLCSTNMDKALALTCDEDRVIYEVDLLSSTVSTMTNDVQIVKPLTTPSGSSYAQGVVKVTFPSIGGVQTNTIKLLLEFDLPAVTGRNFHISYSPLATAGTSSSSSQEEVFTLGTDLKGYAGSNPFVYPNFISTNNNIMEIFISDQGFKIRNGMSPPVTVTRQWQGQYDVHIGMNRAIRDGTSTGDGLKKVTVFACMPN